MQLIEITESSFLKLLTVSSFDINNSKREENEMSFKKLIGVLLPVYIILGTPYLYIILGPPYSLP